ncbi:glycoside hydrolase family 2 TIM barrel-domain containing protein [Niallia sp. NCCP-28]|uniref:glycoside hydrolase family 2 TIM barrel-domain containing protein n=1 Tax=Niallia sp. NCCP-28 TaxID=2934712 RepID=UPI00207DAD21|nr:glycoside hydrolase family 2 TIM barrel-domain containing protein [Niallia sp. NCCP-28]GKU82162.1 beta-galactosidase [Niallia sp. NCCP-28]
MTKNPMLQWLEDPSVFAVNRIPAHSDHYYYETMKEAKRLDSMMLRHSLNGNWKFQYSINPRMRPEKFYELDFDCSSWGNITVPGHIQMQGYGQMQYVNTMYPWDGHHDIRPPEIPKEDNPIGSYVTSFVLPDNMNNKSVYLSFQGVETAFYVWLNGEFAGYSEDSFTPSEFEITPFLKEGENKLAVEVYQRSTGAWLEDQDFWRFSGIFRDVYLYATPEFHAIDVKVDATLDDTYIYGAIAIDLKLSNANGYVKAMLEDKKGKKISEEVFSQSGKLEVDHPLLWSAEDPYLYTLYLQLFNEKDELVEVIPQNVGFRRFELINKVMCLNGKRIVFKGVNRHEFHHRKGRAISKEEMLWDIQTLKRNNINAVRTSHYPNQSYWYELCDKYGVYVIDEMNLETHGSWQKMGAVEPSWNIPGNKKEWLPIVMDRAVSMYERDKNHPSILIWSCGNESYAGEVILEVSKYFKRVDSKRLVHYEGIFHNRDYDEISDMESRMYAKPADIEKYLTENPAKPYISCEYMHAMGNSLGGMYKYTDLETKHELYQGGFIWDYMDQAVEKKDIYGQEFLAYGGDFDDRPTDYGFCTNGIVYANRELSPKMQEVKYLYQDFKLTVDQDSMVLKNESLFTNTEKYLLEYRLYLEGKELFFSTAIIAAPPRQKEQLAFNWPENMFEKNGEYTIIASLHLKERKEWADKGYEIAFGQTVFMVGEKEAEAPLTIGKMRVVEGDVNIGVHGNDFSIMFSRQVGSLISIKYGGNEMISQPPAPLFWRATTDNDRGFQQHFNSGMWFAASLARKCTNIELHQEESLVKVEFTYHFSIHPELEAKIAYIVFSDGSISVKTVYNGADNLPQLPIFAVSFKMPAEYQQLEWYANGPEENYSDRAKGTKLGIFKNTVAENMSSYLMPQESGNHTGVRRLKVTNMEGAGIEIQSIKEPVECNASPYTAFELESANHLYELPPIHNTVLTIAGKQMGVGGDDSWGAPVHKEHVIDSNQHLVFEFLLKRV